VPQPRVPASRESVSHDGRPASSIRLYQTADQADVYRVCLLTGNSGTDATGLYLDDTVVADIYAGPYLELEPELAFVVETERGVEGYAIATAHTKQFIERFREEWLPGFAKRHARPAANPAANPSDEPGENPRPALSVAEEMTERGYRPENMLIDEVDEFPAHLHINLLPSLQGQGLGRELIRTILAALREHGADAVHLGVSPSNTSASAFYRRLGFTELASSSPERPLFGIRTDAEL
jgi:ribosomal protein S18 acetylase RimI-like enzyme